MGHNPLPRVLLRVFVNTCKLLVVDVQGIAEAVLHVLLLLTATTVP